MFKRKERVSEQLIAYRKAVTEHNLEIKKLKREIKKKQLEILQHKDLKKIAKRTYKITKPLA